jgi:hypothetical protein
MSPIETPKQAPEPVISPVLDTSKRIDGIQKTLQSLSDKPFFKRILELLLTYIGMRSKNKQLAKGASRETGYEGGITEEEYRSALKKAMDTPSTARESLMSRSASAQGLSLSGSGKQAVSAYAETLRNNKTMMSLADTPSKPMMYLKAFGLMMTGNQEVLDGARQFGLVQKSVLSDTMVSKESEALKGVVFLSHTCEAEGIAFRPTNKQKDIASIVGLQTAYTSLVQPRSNPPSYAEWVESIAKDLKSKGKTSITVDDLNQYLQSEMIGLLMAKR